MDGGDMDHFLVFLSSSGLPRRKAVSWTIFCSFCHREVYCKGWQWYILFSVVSVTVRSAAMDGGDMDHVLVFLSP